MPIRTNPTACALWRRATKPPGRPPGSGRPASDAASSPHAHAPGADPHPPSPSPVGRRGTTPPGAPAVLEQAGVRFAFYSDGLDAARDLERAVKKALDNGLSREAALRALTLSPAEIY